MTFVVDGSDWSLDGKTSVEVVDAIDDFLEILDQASTQAVTVWFGDDFSSRKVYGNDSIWDLFAPGCHLDLPAELLQELVAHLARAQFYADEPEWPEGFSEEINISINGAAALINMDVAWAHHSVRSRRAVACLGLWRKGIYTTSTKSGVVPLHWISQGSNSTDFWEDAIDVEGNSPASFARFATKAYPQLHFFGNVLSKADYFSGGYHATAAALKNYLKILNKSGIWAFSAAPPAESITEPAGPKGSNPSNQLIQRRLSLLNLDVAPENPNVYQDSKCRLARQITLEDRTLYCEWHCKLEPHRNRIHIHPPVPESKGKLVIAIFTPHLPLP